MRSGESSQLIKSLAKLRIVPKITKSGHVFTHDSVRLWPWQSQSRRPFQFRQVNPWLHPIQPLLSDSCKKKKRALQMLVLHDLNNHQILW